ncbi:MAG: hypothetical protein LBJ18_03680 [Rickettsiales bacterium]|jgi:hypothetical protein|nr:hypothetical protein [Rickettsiales bacterium]
MNPQTGTNISVGNALPQSIVPVSNYTQTRLQPSLVQLLKEQRDKMTAGRQAYSDARAAAEPGYVGRLSSALSNIKPINDPMANPLATALSNFGAAFGQTQQAEQKRIEASADKDYMALLKEAEQEMDMAKILAQETNKLENTNMKVNDGANRGPNLGTAAFFLDPKINEDMALLNTQAGRWDTNKFDPTDKNQGWWSRQGVVAMPGKDYGISSSDNDERARKYQEWSNKATQNFQSDLKRIYGSQLSDAESKRFFDTLGISPVIDPAVRQSLYDQAVERWALENGLPPPQKNNINKPAGFVIEQVQ